MSELLSNSDLEKYEKSQLIELIKALYIKLDVKPLSPEEQICIQQLKILREVSLERELDMEEAKKFEIFHKNLRLARGQVVEGSKKKADRQLSTEQLLEIANE